MGYTCFEIEETEGVAHLILSRPDELNSMIPAFWTELPEIVDELSDSGRHPGPGHLVDRQALLCRHGPFGLHRRLKHRQ